MNNNRLTYTERTHSMLGAKFDKYEIINKSDDLLNLTHFIYTCTQKKGLHTSLKVNRYILS